MSTDKSLPVNSNSGDRIEVLFEGRKFEVIVIDPDGLAPGKPTMGFGLRMGAEHIGLSQQGLSKRVTTKKGEEWLKSPADNLYRVTTIAGTDGNEYKVIEFDDWAYIARDYVLKRSKRISEDVYAAILNWMTWYTARGLYADAYAKLRGSYTLGDSAALGSWQQNRVDGKNSRRNFTDMLKVGGVTGAQYASWTNYIYEALFGYTAAEMKERWQLMAGDSSIARNYVPEDEAMLAISFCEQLCSMNYMGGDLKEVIDDAIKKTRYRFASSTTIIAEDTGEVLDGLMP